MQSPQQAPLSCLLPAMPFHLSVPKTKKIHSTRNLLKRYFNQRNRQTHMLKLDKGVEGISLRIDWGFFAIHRLCLFCGI